MLLKRTHHKARVKRQALRKPQRRLTTELLEDRLLLTVILNDDYAGLDERNGVPPDPILAAGPGNLVAATNRELALFDKTGSLLTSSRAVDFFPDAQTAGFNSTFDPWTIYDPYSQRFFVLFEEVEEGTVNDDGSGDTVTGGFGADEANLLIAVSNTDEPQTLTDADWTFLPPIDATANIGELDTWIDYPKIATDADSVYITGNFFSFGGRDFQGVQIIRLDKQDAAAGVADVTARIDAPGAFTLQPAQSFDRSPGQTQRFVAANDDADSITVFELGDDNVLLSSAYAAPFATHGGGAPQPDSVRNLDTLSSRLMNAVDRDGSIWTTHTVDVQGDATVRWYEIGGAGIIQSGDVRPGQGIHTFMPAISANGGGNMGLTFTQSANNDAAAMMITGHENGQPAGFTAAPIQVRQGATGYEDGTDNADTDVERWGDYAGIAIDPIDDHTFWAFGEIADTSTDWTTVIAQFEVGNMYEDVFDADGMTNNSLASATPAGSELTSIYRDLTIHDALDVDYFRYTAHSTGKLIVNVQFQHALGDLDVRVEDADGNIISSSTSLTDDENIVIPVVSQEEYFVRVFGFNGATNVYALEIENFSAPIPNAVWLDPADDTGMMNNDNVTNEDEARVFLEADLADFADMGVDILSPVEVASGDDGAAVVVIVNGVEVGVATPIPGTNNTLFEYTFDPGDLSTTFIPTGGGGGLNAVKAAVRVFDGQDNQQDGRSEESEPLLLTLDQTGPDIDAPSLLPSSDTGMDPNDNVTNKMQPAFFGDAEANAKVRILANDLPVGSGVATSLGNWEITVEPLRDGPYLIAAVAEDLAGNITISEGLEQLVVIDTVEPNTPYLDLLNDTGHSDSDNITSANLLDFRMVGDDTVDGDGNPTPNDVKYRLYWRSGDGMGEVLVYDSFAEFADFTTLGELNRTVSQDLNDPIGTPFPDGVHNFKLEIEDRAGNISHDFLLPVEIDSTGPLVATIDLIDSSDTGMFENDEVTNKMSPAFNGLSEVEATVTLYAQEVDFDGIIIGDNFVVGTGFVGSDLTDGELGNGLGVWEITSEPLDDGSYLITALIEDWAGNFEFTDPLRIWIDTIRPNTPRLDLVSNSDSGRSDTDNITNDVRPTMTINANDTVTGIGNLLPNGIKYRLYVRPDGDLSVPEILVIDSFTDLGGFTTDNVFTHMVTLDLNNPLGTAFPDGIHNFKLEIEDRAGNISEHFLLDVEFDTVAPLKFFGDPGIGDDGLHPDSDTGLPGQAQTLDDRRTSDATPTFWGFAEANSVIVARLPNGIFLGETVAIPHDGNDAFPNGRWELTSDFDLTLGGLGADGGLRTIVITGEDVAGNVAEEMTLDIFVDVVGPRVNNVFVTDEPDYSLFDPKPSVDGPSPLVDSLSVVITDLPNRVFDFLYPAANRTLLEQGGNFDVFGDHVGQVVISSIEVVEQDVDDAPPFTVVTVNFAEPLPDDRYTLVVSDRIADNVGNALDGDHLTADPRGGGAFPSGDGQPGGDFVARFTIDSRPEVGVWAGGSVYLDTNGNSFFDPENLDDTNEDLVFVFTLPGDDVFAGNFVGPAEGVADGFDKLAAYGDSSQPSNSTGFSWTIDFDNDGVLDLFIDDPANINGLPFAGRWDFNDVNGDEVGVFTGTRWHFDTNHDFRVDTSLNSQLRGYPIAGDFNGDGFDDLGTYNEEQDRFEFDLTNGSRRSFDGNIDALVYTGFAGVRERPVAADMDVDGFDDFGLWVPGRGGTTPRESGEWFITVSGGNSLLNRIQNDPQLNLPTIFFEPVPFGNDYFAQFGDQFALPLLGNFDPPATILATVKLHNHDNPLDVNADNQVSPIDALMVINDLNGMDTSNGTHYPDTNADGQISPHDALLVINALGEDSALRAAPGNTTPIGVSPALPDPTADDDDSEESNWDGVIGQLAEDWLGFTDTEY